jgi:hypothetical protein
MSDEISDKIGNEIINPDTDTGKKVPKAEVSITIKPPKVEKPMREKKELTEGQKRALEKMNEARKVKAAERKAILQDNADLAKKEREEAVNKAKADAEKIADEVVVQKVRGRKEGTKNPPKEPVVRRKPASPPPRQLTHREYTIHALRQRGINVSDDASPYTIKLLLARLR